MLDQGIWISAVESKKSALLPITLGYSDTHPGLSMVALSSSFIFIEEVETQVRKATCPRTDIELGQGGNLGGREDGEGAPRPYMIHEVSIQETVYEDLTLCLVFVLGAGGRKVN